MSIHRPASIQHPNTRLNNKATHKQLNDTLKRTLTHTAAHPQFLRDTHRTGGQTASHEQGMMYMNVDLDSHLHRDWRLRERVEMVREREREHSAVCVLYI